MKSKYFTKSISTDNTTGYWIYDEKNNMKSKSVVEPTTNQLPKPTKLVEKPTENLQEVEQLTEKLEESQRKILEAIFKIAKAEKAKGYELGYQRGLEMSGLIKGAENLPCYTHEQLRIVLAEQKKEIKEKIKGMRKDEQFIDANGDRAKPFSPEGKYPKQDYELSRRVGYNQALNDLSELLKEVKNEN